MGSVYRQLRGIDECLFSEISQQVELVCLFIIPLYTCLLTIETLPLG